jgi:integrase
MATRTLNRLTASGVAVAKGPATLSDGGHLSLKIDKNGNKRWIFLYARNGRERELSLGPWPALSLAAARKKRDAWNATLARGEPLTGAREKQTQTFGAVAAEVIKRRAPAWRGDMSDKSWGISVERHCRPLLDRPIASIDLQDILRTLRPVYDRSPNFAAITRRRVEQVFGYARAFGLIPLDRPNPADPGVLEHLLPPRPAAVNRPALPYAEVPVLVAELRAIPLADARFVAAAALRFVILTSLRAREGCEARWCEIDLQKGLLSISAERMKGGRAHEVPLSLPAVEILREMEPFRGPGDAVFPAQRRAEAIGGDQLLDLLKSLRGGVTVHGFRSSFRDWCGDQTAFPREIAEAALAHVVTGVEGSYRRGSALTKRREMMDAWGRFCVGGAEEGKVIAFSR